MTTRERYLPTGVEFTIETAHRFELDADGRIRRWRAFFDPNPEVDAYREPVARHLIEAAWRGDVDAVRTSSTTARTPERATRSRA